MNKKVLFNNVNCLDYGFLGDETKMKDSGGQQLFVGDVVEIEGESGITYKEFVVKSPFEDEAYINEWENYLNDNNFIDYVSVYKVTSYEDIKEGESIYNLICILD